MSKAGRSSLGQRLLRGLVALVFASSVISANAPGVFAATASPSAPSGELASPNLASTATSPTVVRELTDKRTQASDTYLLSNGNMRVEYYSDPVNYRNPASNKFDRIESSLDETTLAGRLVAVNSANSFRIQLPRTLTGDWVSMEASGAKVSLRPATGVGKGAAVASTVTVSARSVSATDRVYSQAFAGADLSYESRNDGIKESIILAEPGGPTTFGFDLSLSGLSPRINDDRSISLLSAPNGKELLTIPAPVMTDSSGSTVGDELSNAAHYELSGTGPTYRLDVVADPAWLSDPARVYPVMIDPTVTTTTRTQTGGNDTYVSSKSQGTYYYQSALCWINYNDPGANWTEYAYMQPHGELITDMATKKGQGLNVVASRLNLHVNSSDIAVSGDVKGYMCTTSTAVSIPLLNYTNRLSGLGVYSTPALTISSGGTKTFDVTDMVAYWQSLALTQSKCTVMLKGVTAGAHIGFGAADATSNKPTWDIDYAPVPSVTLSSPASGTPDVTNVPNATWTYAESYGNPQSEYQIEVATSTTSPSIATTDVSIAATSVALPVPAGGWANGTTYYAHVRAKSTAGLWSSWSSWGGFRLFVPNPVPKMNYGYRQDWTMYGSYEGASGGLWTEPDANGDGIVDAGDDGPDGRGYVHLDWQSSGVGTTGYKIMLSDGNTWQQVGFVYGQNVTTFTTLNKGIYPNDSQVASLSTGSTGNPFLASSPGTSTLQASVTTTLSGSGVVLNDGTYSYVRASAGNPGPTYWTKIGTGYGGTTAGENGGSVGKDFSAKPVYSGFIVGSTLYNGYATSATSVEGVDKNAAKDSSATTTLTFNSPLLNKTGGADVTGATGNVLLASDSTYVYSVADTASGYLIRRFGTNGSYFGTFSIAAPASTTNGVIADGDFLYMIEWTGTDSARITKVVMDQWQVVGESWQVVNQWTIDQGAKRVVSGAYDPTHKEFWLGRADGAGTMYRYSGPGLDLRDNPAPLYAKMGSGARRDQTHYEFKVVAANSIASADVSASPTFRATMIKHSKMANEDPRHTPVDLPVIAKHDATLLVDKSALQLKTTDLQIASWGPVAELSRVYDSSVTTAGLFATGWRFNFERSLEPSGNSLYYTDEVGDVHRFVLSSGAYISPNGFHGSLSATDSGWAITSNQGHEVLQFGLDGKLASEKDDNGNTVSYVWLGSDYLTIQAANGQSINVVLSAGRVVSAAYTTSAGTRNVTYASAIDTSTVTYYPGTQDSYTVEYGYTGIHLSELYVPSSTFEADGNVAARWNFIYSGNAISEMRLPGYHYVAFPGNSGPTYRISSGEVTDPDGVTWDYGVNDFGSLFWKTHPKDHGSDYSWSYFYSPTGDLHYISSPLGHDTRTPTDLRGNKLFEIDPLGNTTSYTYDDSNRLVTESNPLGAATKYEYNGATVDVSREIHQISSQGATSGVEYSYNSSGTITEQRKTIDDPANPVVVDRYSDFAANGQPQTTTIPSLVVDPSKPAIDVVSHESLDDFGDTKSETDASGTKTAENTYSPSGLLLTSTDPSGVVTGHLYDILGNEIETSQTATGGAFQNWTASQHDPNGRTLVETVYSAPGVADHTTQHQYDLAGRETTTTDSISGVTTRSYDWLGNLASQDPPGQGATTYSYDDDLRLVSELSAGNTSPRTTEYDAAGHTTKVTEPDGSWVSSTYDADGQKTTEAKPTDTGTRTDSYVYNLGGRLTSEVRDVAGDAVETSHTYDLAGREVSTGLGNQPHSTTTYNASDWALVTTDVDSIATTSTYDACGRVLATTTGGKTTSRSYDSQGRQTHQINPDGTTADSRFDSFGRSIEQTLTKTDGGIAAHLVTSYDSLGRSTATTDTQSGVIQTFSYAAGATKTATETVSYASVPTTVTYDSVGLETGRHTSGLGVTVDRTVVARDAGGRAISWTVTGAGNGGVAFDPAGRESTQTGYGFTASGASYGFDPDTGRKVSESVNIVYPGLAWNSTFAYNAEGRLVSAGIAGTTTSYGWDQSGNLTTATAGSQTTSFGYDGNNRLVNKTLNGSTVATYTFDSLGRRVNQGPLSNSREATFTYSDASRLTGYAKGQVVGNYTYDGAGQRTRSVVTSGSLTTTTTYTYDELTLLSLTAARSDNATYSLTYLYEESSRPWAAIYSATGVTPTLVYLVTTDRGDVVELLDSAGSAFASYRYDAWGNPIASGTQTRAAGSVPGVVAADIAARQPLRYAGYVFDDGSGLYYCSQRYYDPATFAFLTKDPLRSDGEQSAYQYCGGDPVDKIDPSGLVTGVEEAWAVYAIFAVCTATIAWYLTPADRREAWGNYVWSAIHAQLHSRPPGNRWRWQLVKHDPHFPMPSLKGGVARRETWILINPEYRVHHHFDIYDNHTGRKVFHSPGF